jgi:NADPH:quinone reductase-like Zn-dependent oxidoreductase
MTTPNTDTDTTTTPTAPIDPPDRDGRPDADRTAAAPVRAIVHDRFGSADVLHLGEVARPKVGPRDVLVQVRAAGLDRGAWHLVAGKPYAIRLAGFGVRRPKHPVAGSELAGVVVEVGTAVTRFQPGDEVFGTARGSFTELAATSEDKLALKPARLTFEQAAALPISGGTALEGLLDAGRLEAGQSVLIIGASGGVGTYAVQIAKAIGAEVTAVCSTAKVDAVRSLGADHVLDYTRDDFADGANRYDLILDLGGNSSLSRLRRALTPTGTLVIGGGEGGGRWLGGIDRQGRAILLSPFVSHRLTTFVGKEHHDVYDRLTPLVDDGLVTPLIDRTYPLAEAPDALRRLEAGEVTGKVVVVI